MSDGSRYYLTTAIAYANNKPGLHTLYEVVGADVIARWHRMKGDDTRFLTGTDEHSINIAQSAVDEGRSAREFVDEKVAYFRTAEDALAIAPDRFIRTTDPDHIRAAQEMVRRAHANGDIYLGTYEGWYCPNEGFRNPTDVQETARGTICPNHPEVPLQWLTERNWFFRLSAYQERLERHFAEHPDFVQPDYRRNEMLGFIRGGLEDFSISRERTPGGWGIPFPISEDGASALLEDGTWDPEAGVIYVWYDALINYITGAGRTCTSSARTSRVSTRSSGPRCCGAPDWTRPATSGCTAGCWRPVANG
jgi:methionyl-tRNA synthetase